jgi:hypothetical protein
MVFGATLSAHGAKRLRVNAYPPFRLDVVGVDEGGHLGSFAGAPDALEQQTVEERRALFLGQSGASGYRHLYKVRANGVPLRLSFYPVQGQ